MNEDIKTEETTDTEVFQEEPATAEGLDALEAQAQPVDVEAEIAKAALEPDTRILKAGPAAEKLLEIVAAHKPVAKEWGPQDVKEFREAFDPIVLEWIQYALENEMTQREIEMSLGLFASFFDFTADLVKGSLQEQIRNARLTLIQKSLELSERPLDEKDLTLKNWDDIIRAQTK